MALIRLKKKKKKINAMSQSSWQIGRPDLNAFFFWTFFFPEQQTCQIWVGHSFEIWNLIFGWARYKTEHRVEEVCCSKCFIVFVISFLVYFDKKVHKKLKKEIKQANKFQTLDFAESNAHRKTNARGSFDIWFIFFSLITQTLKGCLLYAWKHPTPMEKKKKKENDDFSLKIPH